VSLVAAGVGARRYLVHMPLVLCLGSAAFVLGVRHLDGGAHAPQVGEFSYDAVAVCASVVAAAAVAVVSWCFQPIVIATHRAVQRWCA